MMYTKTQAQAEIAKLVEDFQASEARLMSEPEAQIEATDRDIDALVYEMCGLTADEIAAVEGQG
jgi:hypothetical protein